jgi:nicotinate-nucleotide pyrophosphorylase
MCALLLTCDALVEDPHQQDKSWQANTGTRARMNLVMQLRTLGIVNGQEVHASHFQNPNINKKAL